MIDFNRFRYAVTIAKEGSYSAAAHALRISQSALTRSIQALEEDYGIRIFERGRRGAKLTLAGTGFITMAESLIRRAISVDEQLRFMQSERQAPVSFGLGAISAATLLPDLVPGLLAEGMKVRIKIEPSSDLQLLLRQGDIEFFVSGLPLATDHYETVNDFRIQPMPSAPLGLLVREGHPLLNEAITPESLARYPVAAGLFFRETFTPAALVRLGLQAPSIESDDYNLLAKLTRQSDHLLVASHAMAVARPDLGVIALPYGIDIADIRWGLVWPAKETPSPAAVHVAARLMERSNQLNALALATPQGGR